MSRHSKLAIQAATVVPVVGALALWFLLTHGGPTQSAGGLTIAMTDAPDPVAAGGFVTYTITVNNGGANAEDNVVVDDTLTGQGVIVSAAPSQGFCEVLTVKTVHCNLGTLGPGATATVNVEKQAKDIITGGIEVPLPAPD